MCIYVLQCQATCSGIVYRRLIVDIDFVRHIHNLIPYGVATVTRLDYIIRLFCRI